MKLSDIIIQKIKQDGPISFCDFMDMALYYPGCGYYNREGTKIGRSGDFYTSSNLTPVFGELLAKQIEEIWRIMGKKEFTVVEMGAGMGLLSQDVIGYLSTNKELHDNLDYCIVEKSLSMQKEQKKRLADKNVRWYDSINDLKEVNGCIFSNEVPDAFPVHIVKMEKELMEVYVDHKKVFREILRPASTELKNYLRELDIELPAGYRTEINLEASKWIGQIGLILKKGFVITIDYGYPSCELYDEYRNRGTLMCYYNHTVNESPYEHIGEQDITTHVNFSALDHWGRNNGLEPCGFTDQANFLIGLGIDEYIGNLQKLDQMDYYKKILPIKSLMMDMGRTFKVFIQKKGVNSAELSGLKSARYLL